MCEVSRRAKSTESQGRCGAGCVVGPEYNHCLRGNILKLRQPLHVEITRKSFTTHLPPSPPHTYTNVRVSPTPRELMEHSQPAHLVTIVAVVYLAFRLFPDSRRHATEASTLTRLLYIAAVSTVFGSQVWMTFVSGMKTRLPSLLADHVFHLEVKNQMCLLQLYTAYLLQHFLLLDCEGTAVHLSSKFTYSFLSSSKQQHVMETFAW